jgi:hypothetical protein
MIASTSPIVAHRVAQDTALLVPIFRALLADPQVDPVRLSRAADLYGLGNVERQADGSWLVVSACDPEQAYTVDRPAHQCACPDHAKGRVCKHQLACRIFAAVERAEAERQDPTLPPIGYALTGRGLVASVHPLTACAACDHDAADHDGVAGACTRQGVDAEGLYWCDCAAFTLGDDAA